MLGTLSSVPPISLVPTCGWVCHITTPNFPSIISQLPIPVTIDNQDSLKMYPPLQLLYALLQLLLVFICGYLHYITMTMKTNTFPLYVWYSGYIGPLTTWTSLNVSSTRRPPCSCVRLLYAYSTSTSAALVYTTTPIACATQHTPLMRHPQECSSVYLLSLMIPLKN